MKKQHSKKLIFILCLTAIFLLMLTIATYADTTDKGPKTVMFPSISDLFKSQSKYMSRWQNYHLDLKETGIFKGFIMVAVNAAANGLFYLLTGITYLLIIVVYYAFKISFVTLLSPAINAITMSLKKNIYDELAGVFISMLVIFYIAKIIREQKTQVWVAIIQTIVIIALATQFMLYPAKTLKSIEDFSQGASQTILTSTFEATNSGSPDSAVAAACDNIWVMFVHTPWEMLEFGDGDTKYVKEHEDDILSKAPSSDERQKYVNDLAKDGIHFMPDWALDRFVMIILYSIPMLVQVFIIGVLALLMLMYEALFVLIVLAAPFVFLISLIPWLGFRTLRNYFSKLIGYGSMKIILSFFIAVLFSIDTSLFTISNKQYGWYLVLLLQLIVAVGIYWKRSELLSFISNIGAPHELPGAIDRQMRKGVDVEKYIKHISNMRYNRADNANSNKSDANYGTENKNNLKENFSSTSTKTKGSSNSYDEPHEYGNEKRDDHTRQDNSLFDFDLDNANSNNKLSMRELIKLAEEILENQYETSKLKSEEKSMRSNKDPEYSYFVKTVMNREKMNLPKFEESEKMAVARQAKRIVDAGGNPREMFTEQQQSNNEVQRPEKVIISDNGSNEEVSKKEMEEVKVENSRYELDKDFSNNFDVKQGSYDMKAIIDTYGENNVKYVIDEMKKMEVSQHNINKPINYLIESLKNNKNDSENLTRLKINEVPEATMNSTNLDEKK